MDQDKKLHSIVGIIAPVAFVAVMILEKHIGLLPTAIVSSFALAIAKEIADPYIGGTRDWKDAAHHILFTCIIGAAMLALETIK